MAVGDAVGDIQSVSAGSTFTIKATTGQEWIVHNIFHEGPASVYITNGTIRGRFTSDTSEGLWAGFFFHVTENQYLEVVNDDTVARIIAFDGIQSK